MSQRGPGVSLMVLVLSVLAFAQPAIARRLPAPGGKITVSLPPELLTSTSDAHLYVPLVEPSSDDDAAALLAHPPLPGLPEVQSAVLRSVIREDSGAVWRLLPGQASAASIGESVARCLSKRSEGSWPAAALTAAGVDVEVIVSGNEVRLKVSVPFGPMLELLSGCSLRPSSGAHTGGYTLGSGGTLVWRSGGYGPPPLLGIVELSSAPQEVAGFAAVASSLSPADLVAFGSESPGSATLLAPFPDVIVLLQSPGSQKSDPLGLFDVAVGTLGFRQRLRADLLAAAYAQGRGGVADGLLPPGIAPARPLPQPVGPERTAPLVLVALPADAPRLIVRRAEGDPLIDGVVERLAVLLRNRGSLVDVQRRGTGNDGIEVLRWRPPTRDPALALLSLAGMRPELLQSEAAKKALADPRLLSALKQERVAASLTLERAWLDAGLAVPLLQADRWFTADADLRGVRIREDGVPLLHDATFVAAPGGLR